MAARNFVHVWAKLFCPTRCVKRGEALDTLRAWWGGYREGTCRSDAATFELRAQPACYCKGWNCPARSSLPSSFAFKPCTHIFGEKRRLSALVLLPLCGMWVSTSSCLFFGHIAEAICPPGVLTRDPSLPVTRH